ncbi:hypothetical protein ACQKTA_05480 [Enterococcus sp. 22-H-5-01]|uniref:hypothetical protein n=1 Tax=Enterococcus sp. 22-H-5-01 TaxID=3418555 RepID=UPI003D08A0FE
MLGIDNELEQLYQKAKQEGEAAINSRWTAGNYGCCSTRAPLVEKFKIQNTSYHSSFYLWGSLLVKIYFEDKEMVINNENASSNYEKKIIDWFIQKFE